MMCEKVFGMPIINKNSCIWQVNTAHACIEVNGVIMNPKLKQQKYIWTDSLFNTNFTLFPIV